MYLLKYTEKRGKDLNTSFVLDHVWEQIDS